ncbi:MAG: D-glycero-beta-D-manno-heptose 1-phosphate adenylyltransferase [Deltaproteobacteria bacterium]|jgi:D-beta-D-heptose 7-phosphate kinase/D-beta-D-heptose 1-phosphate adenosyltransferase|nr:D-glycero-beta-D-manno-heptose 1-phosphate adenylyltransferase [Deltaproteobacteria bacterium]
MSYRDKILTLDEAIDDREGLEALGRTLVMTNGCFDLLHPGHLRYLDEARSLGDYLLVAINDDASVKRLKGPLRPIRPLKDRIEMLAALQMVSAVVSFTEDTPLRIIELIKPNILVKGGDFSVEDIVGGPETIARGGQVRSLKFAKGYSTTSLIAKIQSLANLKFIRHGQSQS